MEIKNLSEEVEEFTANVWIVQNDEDTVIVDAGTGDEVWSRIEDVENVDRVVITHSHYDHVDNLPRIIDLFDTEVLASEPENLPVEAKKIAEEVELCGESFQVINTPGHRDDSICLYSERTGILFTGDLVFADGGFGRTDLEDGDRDKLIESIEKLGEIEVKEFYPGHGESVTREAEEQIERSLENAQRREDKYS